MSKICAKCKVEKPYEDFDRSSRYKDGRYSRCKLCMKEYKEATEDPVRRLELRKMYRERHRESIRERDREAYAKDPDKFRAKARVSQKKYFNTEKGREKYRLKSLKLREKYPEKARARSLLSNAICDGVLTRPSSCSLCGFDAGVIEAHHSDYSKPLEVVWVCKSCHFMIHKRIKHRRDRLSEKTSKEDATVKTCEETARGDSEEGPPPS